MVPGHQLRHPLPRPGDRSLNSEYISTSGSQGLAESFARSQGANTLGNLALNSRCSTGRMAAYAILPGIGQYLLYRCLDGVVTARTYVYLIDPAWASNAMYIPDQIRGDRDLYNHYHSQDEWAYVRHIPASAITGVRIYTMTAQYHNGFIRPQTIDFHYDQFVANPQHVRARVVVYDPARDRSAEWGFDTALDSPTANSYTRGCSTITMCRGGGSGG